jgi:glyoxylase-like metal-dependent hydrolase (beta-lactamase superfamily II)
VDVQEIADGLWRWTAPHPAWTPDEGGPEGWEREVGCVYYEAPDAVCLIDPLVPQEEAERFWRALDRDVALAGKPVVVLLTVHWHSRSADEIAARYGAGREPPAGVELFPVERGYEEVIFWLPEHGALVPGDALLGAAESGVRLCPPSWRTKIDDALFRSSLERLLDLPVERVLVSHGEPVLTNGRDALARALS